MTDPETSDVAGGVPRLVLVARVVIPVALGIAGYAVLASERWIVDHELQLVAPDASGRSGEIPIRAFVFAGISGDEAGELADVPIEVTLRCDGATVAETTLSPGALHSAEGSLVYRDADGRCTLRASALDASGAVLATAVRPLEIAPDLVRQPLLGRLAGELQHLLIGPLAAEPPGTTVPAVEVRVSNGTCVPEQPCELLVRAPEADGVEIEPGASVSAASTARDASGTHTLVVVAHGPEASTTLWLSRGGQRIARADLRLPVALATPWLEPPSGFELVRDGDGAPVYRIDLRPPPGRDAVIVDTFVSGRWASTASLRGEHVDVPAPAIRGAPVATRVQVRADPFGGDAIAATYLPLPAPDPHEPSDPLRAEGIALPDGLPPALALAAAAEEIRQLPAAVSGLEDDRARVAARRRMVQVVAAVALALGIVIFALTLLRRGLRAAEEAREVMSEAGDVAARSRSTRIRMTLAVLAFVGAVAVALLAGAALILARAALVAG